MPTDDEWISTRDAAELLGIRIRDLYRMIDNGDLPVSEIEGAIRIRRDDLGR
jgi:excisionase family DNA binding protein